MFDINYPAGLTTIIVLVLFGISLNALFLVLLVNICRGYMTSKKIGPITIIEERIDNN